MNPIQIDSDVPIPPNAFLLRLDHRFNDCFAHDYVAIGWSMIDDFDKLHFQQDIRERLLAEVAYDYANARAAGNAAGSIWRFVQDMRVGDLILVPTSSGFFVAECTGGVLYRQDLIEPQDAAWTRQVKWLTSEAIPRTHASNRLQLRGKARQTCVNAYDLLDEIKALPQTKSRPSTKIEIKKKAHAAVLNVLQDSINDSQLEKLVCDLAIANGAVARVRGKNEGQSGDIDVEAIFMSAGVEVRIAYQVKQHRGTTDEQPVKQLLEALREESDFDIGIAITTGDKFSESASEMIEKARIEGFDIRLMNAEDLSNWLLDTGTRIWT